MALFSQLRKETENNNAEFPQWLSTHPSDESRAKKLDSKITAVSVVKRTVWEMNAVIL